MVLRFQRLTDATRRHFGIHRDPFAAPQSHDDVFLSPDIRYAREALMDKCRHGGFLALIGESGSGKSTLREELNDRLQREKQPVIVIEPYIVAMEDNDTRGKALKAQHIGESIMRAIAPLATTKSSPEARWAQMHEALKDSARAGNRHVLIIEEAHSLPVPTIRHLKRFLELKDGMRQLIAVVLIGQQELERKLSDTDPTVREIVQRIEIVHLHPLDNELEPFLRHRFERVGLDLKKIVAPGAIDAMRVALSPSGKGSLLYPLAVQNMVSRALNAAAGIGAPLVDAAVVRSV